MARGKSRAAQRKTSTNMRNNNNNNEAKKKKKLTFCMVCKVRYDDLEQVTYLIDLKLSDINSQNTPATEGNQPTADVIDVISSTYKDEEM